MGGSLRLRTSRRDSAHPIKCLAGLWHAPGPTQRRPGALSWCCESSVLSYLLSGSIRSVDGMNISVAVLVPSGHDPVSHRDRVRSMASSFGWPDPVAGGIYFGHPDGTVAELEWQWAGDTEQGLAAIRYSFDVRSERTSGWLEFLREFSDRPLCLQCPQGHQAGRGVPPAAGTRKGPGLAPGPFAWLCGLGLQLPQ